MNTTTTSDQSKPGDAPLAGASDVARVLLVDDDLAVLRATGRALRRLGLQITEATSGSQALEKMRAAQFDAVVTDIAMPDMNGIALMREVRALDPHLHSILVTGAPTLETAVAALDEGAFKYLQKPFDPKVLAAAIDRATALSRLAREESCTVKSSPWLGALPDGTTALATNFERALSSASVVYQPLVVARSGRVAGLEAFVRSGDASLPDALSFVRAAERLGRSNDVGRFVRDRASSDFRRVEGEPLLFVNIHPNDLLDPALVDWGGGLKPFASRVVLEISEHVDLTCVPNAVLRVASLRKMGFRIALDDVGSGAAGISRFSRLDPEFIKLDVTLVRGIDEDDGKRRVVSALTGRARDLRMLVVAEGVETVAESQTLRDLGCDLLQGYLFARPGPPFPKVSWPHELGEG